MAKKAAPKPFWLRCCDYCPYSVVPPSVLPSVHSSDDNVVPTEYGYDIYYERYRDDPRFSFIRLEDKGHNYVYDDDTYVKEFNTEFDKWIETLDYDYTAAENKERFSEDKASYIRNNLDRGKWCNMLNSELFEEFTDFYDASTYDLDSF